MLLSTFLQGENIGSNESYIIIKSLNVKITVINHGSEISAAQL